jgi:hypothetical protein
MAKVTLVAVVLLVGCGSPTPSPDVGTDASVEMTLDAGRCGTALLENLSTCQRPTTSYQPRARDAGPSDWPACVSDDGVYRLLGTSVPSAAPRVTAFDSMGVRLWGNSRVPTADDFTAARVYYSIAEGLASRVARRQDVSASELPGTDKFACANAGVPEMYPERCAGPAKLKPLIDDAFVRGTAGDAPAAQAGRIEAALVWFLHLSVTSEVWTCSFDKKNDCDSSAAYYLGDLTSMRLEGLASRVSVIAPATHAAIRDALLATRCWRDVDMALPATNQLLYRRSADGIDLASTRGVAVILRERMVSLGCSSGPSLELHKAFVTTLGGLLDSPAVRRDAARASRLRTFVSAPTAEGITSAVAELDALFGCPY